MDLVEMCIRDRQYIDFVKGNGIRQSMDGKSRWADNIIDVSKRQDTPFPMFRVILDIGDKVGAVYPL